MTQDTALAMFRADLVAAAGRQATTRRRKRKRLKIAAATVAISALTAGAAVAASTLLSGQPAPPDVVSDFGSYAPGLGFHPNPGQAVEVASDGDATLYATTNQEGSYCLILSTPWKRPGTLPDGGSCLPSAQADLPLTAFTAGARTDQSTNETTFVVDGRASDPNTATISFASPTGSTITRPVGSDGFFVAEVTVAGSACNVGTWTPTVQALDGNGNNLASATETLWRGCVSPTTP
jgi:hypothetical protein